MLATFILCLVIILKETSGFYLPGITPKKFKDKEPLCLNVNSLTSRNGYLPIDHYSLPLCRPSRLMAESENLGQVLLGSRIYNAPYNIKMNHQEECTVLCPVTLLPNEIKSLLHSIKKGYERNFILDNLPVALATLLHNQDDDKKLNLKPYYERGIPLGKTFIDSDGLEVYEIYNHVRFIIDFRESKSLNIPWNENLKKNDAGKSSSEERNHPIETEIPKRVVGAFAEAVSIQHKWDGYPHLPKTIISNGSNPSLLELTSSCRIQSEETYPNGLRFKGNNIDDMEIVATPFVFTYEVIWRESETPWANRWDPYLTNNHSDRTLHWFSIINSFLIALFLSSLSAIILSRMLNSDIERYNRVLDTEEGLDTEIEKNAGWKQLTNDIFRYPIDSPLLWASSMGSGAALLFVFMAVIFLSMMGILSPSQRGSLFVAIIVTILLGSVVSGYVAAKFLKFFSRHGGIHSSGSTINGNPRRFSWKLTTALTLSLFPVPVIFLLVLLDLIVWGKGSTSAAPFLSMMVLATLFLFIYIPLGFLGSYAGFMGESMTLPKACKYSLDSSVS
eukprot:g20.t1